MLKAKEAGTASKTGPARHRRYRRYLFPKPRPNFSRQLSISRRNRIDTGHAKPRHAENEKDAVPASRVAHKHHVSRCSFSSLWAHKYAALAHLREIFSRRQRKIDFATALHTAFSYQPRNLPLRRRRPALMRWNSGGQGHTLHEGFTFRSRVLPLPDSRASSRTKGGSTRATGFLLQPDSGIPASVRTSNGAREDPTRSASARCVSPSCYPSG